MWWVVGVVAVVVAVATYLTWLAARVDRLHARAAGASSALDAALRRRAARVAAVSDAAERRCGEPARVAGVAARSALSAAPPDREAAENEMTRRVRRLGPCLDATDRTELAALGRRVALARQVHTDLVRDALALRRQRLVRLLRLARRHPRPVYVDIDDPAAADTPALVGGGSL